MRPRNILLTVALVVAMSVFSAGAANAGAFGVPDPTVGAQVLGWFDLGVDCTDDVLAVILNASDLDFPGMANRNAPGVHFIIWSVRSAHVWDSNLTFTPWDIEALSIRDTIENMPASQQNALVQTVTYADGSGEDRYRGYWTATTAYEDPDNLNPPDPDYPHAYLNVLTGWVYLVDILAGRTDGYSMISVEASTLFAGDFATAFALSFSADFWNRWWWWCSFLFYDTSPPFDPDDDGIPNNEYGFPDYRAEPGNKANAQEIILNEGRPVPGGLTYNDPWHSNLWDSANNTWYGGELRTEYDDTKVFERFDAIAGINAKQLTRGYVTSGDDVWLGRTGTGSQPYSDGGMVMTGRYFKNPASGVTDFANKLVLWADVNGPTTGVRHVVASVFDEEENSASITLQFPDELNIFALDDVVGDNPAGVIVFDTNDIADSNGRNGMRLMWRYMVANADPNSYIDPLDLFYPWGVSASLSDALIADARPNELQLLGWTTNEGLGSVQESWSASFLMNRDCYDGIADSSNPSVYVLQHNRPTESFVQSGQEYTALNDVFGRGHINIPDDAFDTKVWYIVPFFDGLD